MDFTDDPVWAAIHPAVGHLLRDHELAPTDVGLPRFDVLPTLTTRGSCEVALWMVRRGRALDDRVGSTELLEGWITADRQLDHDDGLARLQTRTQLRTALHLLAETRPRGLRGLPHRAARVVTGASYSIQGTLVAMAKLLGQHDDVSALATALDAEILRSEAQAGFDRYAPDTEVREVLWRGDQGTKPAGHFLVRTPSGFGLLTKLDRRWQVVLGDHEAVLASLPDPLFPQGVAEFFAAIPG